MQLHQPGFSLWAGLAKLVPVMGGDLKREGVAHSTAQLIHLRDQQLSRAQVPIPMGLNQLCNIHQPELWPLRWGCPLPTGKA